MSRHSKIARKDFEVLLAALNSEIEDLYRQIRDLVANRAHDPGLKEAVRPLRERLRALQELEADTLERRFKAQLLFNPQKGRQLLEQAERMLREEAPFAEPIVSSSLEEAARAPSRQRKSSG